MGLRRAFRWMRNRFSPGALILLYHRVTDLPEDTYALSVSPRHFAEHLEVLKRRTHPMSLRRLVAGLREGTLPRLATVITFDDGYADNFLEARPILEKFDLPATVFVASGYVGTDREFWWDELERVLLAEVQLPHKLELEISGKVHDFDLSRSNPPRPRLAADTAEHQRPWSLLSREDPTPRHAALRTLWQLLREVSDEERRRGLEQLRDWSGIRGQARPTHRAMTVSELSELAKGPFEIGAHTVTHPVLSACDPTVQRAEMADSRRALEELLGREVTSFAYPYGRGSDYDDRSVRAARDTGFASACTTRSEVVRTGEDLFQLPRASPRDFDGNKMDSWLDRFFPG